MPPSPLDDESLLRLQSAAMDQAGEAIILLEDTSKGYQGRRVVSVNRAFTEMTGYKPADVIGRTLFLLKGPDTNQDALDRIAAAMEEGRRVTEDILNYRRDGTTFWARCTIAPVQVDAGRPAYWVSVQRDITPERRAQERARESEARYAALVDSFPNGAIFLFDHDLRFTLAGGEALRGAGFPPGRVIGRTLTELLPEARGSLLETAYRDAIEGTASQHVLSFAGRTYETEFVPVADAGKTIAGMVVAVDITDRRRAKQQLADSETRYRIVAENMRDLVCLHRLDGSTEWASPSVEQLLGFDQEAFSRMPLRDVVHADDLERLHAEAFEPVLDGATGTRDTFRMRHRDGGYIWFEMLTRPVQDDDDRVIKLMTTSRDVTERKSFEDRLVRAKEHAEKMNRLKTAFLANMSHEIRTPLTNVIGFADLLASEVEDPQRPFVRHIQRGGRRLLLTLNSVLDHAQLESETVRIRPSPLDLVELVEDAVSFFRPQAEQNDVDLAVDLPPGETHIYTDPGALERVVNNLISNALKFTPSGSVRIGVHIHPDHADGDSSPRRSPHEGHASTRISSTPETDRHHVTAGTARIEDLPVEIRVSDTGVGIDEAFLPYLFTPFEQESTGISRSFEGTGLGLSISARLVQMLGGVIAVDTQKGSGSTFRIHLPRSIHREPMVGRDNGE
jgi:PAS domain S-box-containing protein